MSRVLRRRVVTWGVATVLALALTPFATAGTITAVLTGNTAPGTSGGTFSNFTNGPRLNDAGQIAFSATLTGGDVVGTTNNIALYSGAVDSLTIAARRGDAAPGTTGVFQTFSSAFLIDQNGSVAFDASLLIGTGGVTAADDRGVWISSGGVVGSVVVREGVTNANPGGPTGPGVGTSAIFQASRFPSFAFNNGKVAFRELLSNNGAITTDGAWVGDSGGLTYTVLQRRPPNAPGTSFQFSQEFHNGSINNNGDVMVVNGLNGGPRAIYAGTPGNHAALTLVALGGEQAPGTPAGTTYTNSFATGTATGFNDANQVFFRNTLSGAGVDATNDQAMFFGSAVANVQLVAREGSAAPGTATTFDNLVTNSMVLNGAGHVAFIAGIDDGTAGNQEGVWAGPAGGLNLIARVDDTAVDADGNAMTGVTHTNAFGTATSGLAMIAGGQVIFGNTLTGTGVTAANDRGFWIADQVGDARLIVREGQSLAGSTVADTGITMLLESGGEDGRRTTTNRFGQVAYQAALTNGSVGIFLYTPELHWRRTNSAGAWDNADNWTLTLDPGNPHDVFIDPDVNVKVSGPAGAVTVKSLTIGGGAGNAELNLQAGGSLTVTDGVSIASNGALTGNGTITGDVTAGGTIAPGNSPGQIVIDGDLTLLSTATLTIEVFGPAPGSEHDQLVVSGAIDLGGATFILGAGKNVNFGDVLTIIDNTGVGSISGQFAGLGEGAVVLLSGSPFATISYVGGDGNNVTLTIIPEPTAVMMLGVLVVMMVLRGRGLVT